MYDYLKGRLTFSSPNKITLETGGIGYSLQIPFSNFAKLPELGKDLLIYCFLVVKEDSHTLFGFLEKKEKELFQTLINLSGIGPKTALAIIGHIDYSHFFLAIAKADIKMLSKIPGLGKKSAERLIVEMRGKVTDLGKTAILEEPTAKGPAYDAISALMNLGYTSADAQTAVKKALNQNKDNALQNDTGKIIALALKQI